MSIHKKRDRSGGFALIAALLLLAVLSGIAVGLLLMVNTETSVGGHDMQNSRAYHSAEGAIEKMTADLANTFNTIQAPSAADISNLSNFPPTNDKTTSFPVYQVTPGMVNGQLNNTYAQVSSGPNQGLYAQIIPVTLSVTAQHGQADQVSMTRTAEIALIPVFQFGVFSESDLAFLSTPNLDFRGRVHTNGDLYLGVANGYTATFHDKITAYGNVIRKVLPNGVDATNSNNNDQGTVNVLTSNQGCDSSPLHCRSMAQSEGSVSTGPTSSQSAGWGTTSLTTYNGWMIDGNYGLPGGTGAGKLSLTFVGGGAMPYEIIRRPPATEPPSSAVGQSRLGNEAQIRVLLSDQQADLHLSDWNGDVTQDVELASLAPACLLPGGSGYAQNGVVVNGNTYYFGEASTAVDATFVKPPYFHGAAFPGAGCNTEWPLVDGWLLVEVRESDGLWHAVTHEWLSLGFARGISVPTAPGTNSFYNANTDHKNAILYFQKQADRNGDGKITSGSDGSTAVFGVNSQYNWYPLNLYDSREGENWDSLPASQSTCTPNGVINVVELDVGNLKNWLTNAATGKLVDYKTQNGYIFYFSDRRGMQMKAGNTALVGEYGFEDTINLAGSGKPDGKLEAAMATPNGKIPANTSPEDVNGNGALDTYGVAHVGDAFGAQYATDTNTTNPPNPYAPNGRMNCYTTARANRITGARHALKLVDAGLGNVPTKPDGTGGFTVGSENPVYVQGNYNSAATTANPADTSWNNGGAEPAHAAAAIIADAVTLLSNSWHDSGFKLSTPVVPGSLLYPTNPGCGGSPCAAGATPNRIASTTYYRMAIAAGKSKAFSNGAGSGGIFFGTDGGLPNFLRFLEDWTGQTLNYKGSLVSLYYSTYATGTFKCCTLVYHPPARNYVFDPLFAQPQNLPPGTPMFRDVDNLSYRQNFVARTN